MDALPLVLNQRQLQLMHDGVSQTIAQLQQQAEQFNAKDDQQREQNLLTYGTDNYQEACSLVEAIDQQIQSQLNQWNGESEKAKPVEINLSSYQIEVLRRSIVAGMNHLDRSNNGQDEAKTKNLFEDIMEQLPEDSPQENAD